MNEKQDLSYITIEDKTIPVVLERKERKTLSIGIQEDGSLMIKAPLYMKQEIIERFLNQKRYWIYKQVKRMEDNRKNRIVYSREQERVLRQQARIRLTERTDYYKKILGVDYNRIRIADQKTRWGSCSSTGTISYNWHLVLLPDAILDYVVVHELCHVIQMNHSKEFWALVEQVLPDYRMRRKWLKEKGDQYLRTHMVE
ncbi:MAG: SprT family zinc-dependent metalloprotease [Lachnospiraceae bacterium]|nr:SprT family zinc-dependent metalloprotease [Lachnospiraceae bacterium]